MLKKSKRVNNGNAYEITKDLSDLNLIDNVINSTIQSDNSNDNLNTSNSSELKQKQKALVKYKYSAKK